MQFGVLAQVLFEVLVTGAGAVLRDCQPHICAANVLQPICRQRCVCNNKRAVILDCFALSGVYAGALCIAFLGCFLLPCQKFNFSQFHWKTHSLAKK